MSKKRAAIFEEFLKSSNATTDQKQKSIAGDLVEKRKALVSDNYLDEIGPTEINPFILEMTQVEESAPKALAEREQTVSKALAEMSKRKTSVSDFINILEDAMNSEEAAAFAPEQTDIKEIANGYQRGNKEITEQVSIEQQRDNKQVSMLSKKYRRGNKEVTERITEQITIGQQRDNKEITKRSFEALVGNEKNLLLLIFKECLRVGSLISPEITLSYIHEALGVSPGVAKMVIHRLVKKGVITRELSKTGRGGWIKFSIEKQLYQDLRIRETDIKEITNGYQRDIKEITERITEQITNTPSKLDSKKLINNYLTNEEPNTVSEKDTNWFKALDFSPVSPIGAMQVNSSIRALVQEKLQREQVQEFLNRFKNWLATQQKIQNPLAIFCDRLKEFATEGDSAILSVMTDQEREIEAQFIEETKKARVQIQLIEKAQIEKSKNQEENLRTEAEAEFEKWYNSASDVELAQMTPPIDIAPLRSGLHKISTKSAFMSKILLEKQK